jgi:hypothetical protein
MTPEWSAEEDLHPIQCSTVWGSIEYLRYLIGSGAGSGGGDTYYTINGVTNIATDDYLQLSDLANAIKFTDLIPGAHHGETYGDLLEGMLTVADLTNLVDVNDYMDKDDEKLDLKIKRTELGRLADEGDYMSKNAPELALKVHTDDVNGLANLAVNVYPYSAGYLKTIDTRLATKVHTSNISTLADLSKYYQTSAIPTNATLINSHNNAILKGLLTVDITNYYQTNAFPDNATMKSVYNQGVLDNILTVDITNYYSKFAFPANATEKSGANDLILNNLLDVDITKYYPKDRFPANATLINSQNNDILKDLLDVDITLYYPKSVFPDNATLINSQNNARLANLLRVDITKYYLKDALPDNATEKTDDNDDTLNNLLDVDITNYYKTTDLPQNAIARTDANAEQLAAILTTTHLADYLNLDNLPAVTNYVGLRPDLYWNYEVAFLAQANNRSEETERVVERKGVYSLSYLSTVWDCIDYFYERVVHQRSEFAGDLGEDDGYDTIWESIDSLKRTIANLRSDFQNHGHSDNGGGGGGGGGPIIWIIPGGGGGGNTTGAHSHDDHGHDYKTNAEIRLAVVSHDYTLSPVKNDNDETVALPWVPRDHDFTAYLTDSADNRYVKQSELSGYIPVSDYPYEYTNPWYDITGGGITSAGNLVFNSNDATASFSWTYTEQSANCMVLLGNQYSVGGVDLGGNLGIGADFSTYNPTLLKLPQHKLHVKGDIKADTHGAGGSKGGSIIAARNITAAGDITATGGIFGANIGIKDAALVDDANYNTVWSSIKHLSGQIGGSSHDHTLDEIGTPAVDWPDRPIAGFETLWKSMYSFDDWLNNSLGSRPTTGIWATDGGAPNYDTAWNSIEALFAFFFGLNSMIGGRPVDADGVQLQGTLWSHIASTDNVKLGEPEWTRIVVNDGTGNPLWSTYDFQTFQAWCTYNSNRNKTNEDTLQRTYVEHHQVADNIKAEVNTLTEANNAMGESIRALGLHVERQQQIIEEQNDRINTLTQALEQLTTSFGLSWLGFNVQQQTLDFNVLPVNQFLEESYTAPGGDLIGARPTESLVNWQAVGNTFSWFKGSSPFSF